MLLNPFDFAAREIQRIWRGYKSRCRLENISLASNVAAYGESKHLMERIRDFKSEPFDSDTFHKRIESIIIQTIKDSRTNVTRKNTIEDGSRGDDVFNESYDNGNNEAIKDSNFVRNNDDVNYLDVNRPTKILDVMFTIKTAQKFHRSRLKLLLETWAGLLINQVYAISDGEDPEYAKRMKNNHLIDTGCPYTHARRDLCCKMGYELKTMVQHVNSYRWFCRADDDTYYHDVGLVSELNRHNWTQPFIIGNKHAKAMKNGSMDVPNGNAGVCMTRSLINNLAPYISNDKFPTYCVQNSFNDDVALGVLAQRIGKAELIMGTTMYSHGDFRVGIKKKPLITLTTINYRERNGVIEKPCLDSLSPSFSLTADPTRLYTLHCHLHPHVDYCSKLFTTEQYPNISIPSL